MKTEQAPPRLGLRSTIIYIRVECEIKFSPAWNSRKKKSSELGQLSGTQKIPHNQERYVLYVK